ncbi:hypothetical protein EU557_02090 [Hymenobacter wooponensis]|uniref:Uncharacterized protein n=2 Tax=Hymenobacter wooponensis TaxID=1525360 RepID=A0A4Z0MTI3_9BACT|nr:hypothetical protein EU557_02090 [Hymenobacter wooponensis]
MKHQLLLVAVAISGAVVGRLTSLPPNIVGTAQAATPQQTPPRGPRYPGGTGHDKPAAKEKAKGEAKRYQTKNPPSENSPKAYLISRKVIDSVLHQPGCIGLRIYPAYVNSQQPYEPSLIVVGVARKGKTGYQDQVGTYQDNKTAVLREYIVGQTDDRCPSSCDGTEY